MSEVKSTDIIRLLQQYYKSLAEHHEAYEQIFSHTKSEYTGKSLPTIWTIDCIKAFLESNVLKFDAKVRIPFFTGGKHELKQFDCKLTDKTIADNFNQFFLTEGLGACLCILTDGSLAYVQNSMLSSNRHISSVLQFSSSLSDFSRDAIGVFDNCVNLVYVAPLPEGVTDFSNAFKNCTALNCPIFLPSTAKNIKNMLDGCISFSNKIYGEAFLSCEGHEDYMHLYGGSY